MKTKLAIAAVLLVVLAVVLRERTAGSAAPQTAASSARAMGAEPMRSAPARSTERAARRPTLPRPELDHQALAPSLQGTEIDGHLAADEHGNLILSLGVRDFFDYFLSAADEASLEEVLAFMERYARARLPARAADQLMALLDDYLAFKRSAAELMKKPLVPAAQQTREYYLQTLEETFDQLAALRRRHMSPEAVDAFFRLEEEYGLYTLDRMYIELDPDLDAAAKEALIAELRQELPEPLRASETRQVAHVERSRATREILASSASAADKRAALAQHHGPETVERIMSYVERKEQFRARVDRYLAEKAELVAHFDGEELERRVDELRRRHFRGRQELILARTYEARQR